MLPVVADHNGKVCNLIYRIIAITGNGDNRIFPFFLITATRAKLLL